MNIALRKKKQAGNVILLKLNHYEYLPENFEEKGIAGKAGDKKAE
jgi:hypothetical protein